MIQNFKEKGVAAAPSAKSSKSALESQEAWGEGKKKVHGDNRKRKINRQRAAFSLFPLSTTQLLFLFCNTQWAPTLYVEERVSPVCKVSGVR